MAKEDQEKIQQLLDELKEEIFVELDRRVRRTEKSLSGQINEVETNVEEQIVQKLKPWRKRTYNKFQKELQDFQNRFSYYKFPYAATVVVGFMLFWYGMWAVLPTISFLNENGFIPIGIGLLLLFISGATYKKLVG